MTWKITTAKKGQRSPPPLPMYERVVLKHVPTMVRRRYDRDLNIIDENQEKGEDDEAQDLDNSFGDCEAAEDDTHESLDTEYDSQSGSCSKDCEDGHDGTKAEDLVRYVEPGVDIEAHDENEHDCKSKGEEADGANISVQGEIQDMEDQSFDDKHVQDYLDSKERKEEVDRANDVDVSSYVDASVKNDVQEIEQENDKGEDDGIIKDNQSDLASDYKDGSVQDEFQGNQQGNQQVVLNFNNQHGSCIENLQCKGDGFKDGASEYVDMNLSNDAQDKEQGNSDENKNEKTTLSFGKDFPVPLPMYERVLLKHVPTIVRRRYDKELNKYDTYPDLSEEDVKSKRDLGENFLHNDNFGSSTNIQSEEITSEDGVENDQGSYSNDVQEEDDTAREVILASDVDTNIKTEPKHREQGLHMEDCKTNVGGTKDNDDALGADVDEIDTSVENEVKHNEYGNDGNKQDSCSKDVEDDRATNMKLGSDVHSSVKNKAKHDEQGLHVDECESEGGGIKDVNDVASYDLDENLKHRELVMEKGHLKEHENFDNKQDIQSEEITSEDGVKNDQGSYSKDVQEEDDTAREVILASVVDTNIRTEPKHREQDCKTNVGGTKDNDDALGADVDEIDTSVENEVKHNEYGNDGNNQGLCTKDYEDDRAIDMKRASDVDAGVKNEAEHDEQGLHVEGCESEGGGVKDVNDVASYHMDEIVKHREVVMEKGHLKEHDNLDNKQGSCTKDVEDDRAIDMKRASDVDASVKNEAKHAEKGLHVEECESEGVGVKDVNDVASYHMDENVKLEEVIEKGHLKEHENLDNKPDLIPEAFVKTLEQEGYDLYCPNCKHHITHTMIFRRKGDRQKFKTTCFTFLISLFCCK